MTKLRPFSRRHEQQRGKNLAMLAVLGGLCLLFYLITIVKMMAQ
jgi:hypothetical protein